ncbi:type II secretion system F family protein [Actinomadura atramentaria]|uniref:type II secretion system F family protein n=1 Tax=Actinomadura atramentaria TaxID=1990 RepID=UPI0003613905|nr:type II secretion system F family protein [Actinomadura atramentaria]
MTALWIAVACFAACGLLLPRPASRAEQRVRAAARAPTEKTGVVGRATTAARERKLRQGAAVAQSSPASREQQLRRGAAVAAGFAVALVVGGVAGVVGGLVVAVAADRGLGRLDTADERKRRARIVADLPLAVDLLAACLRGGTPWDDAVTAVATAVAGPLGDELHAVAARIRLGADPADAWSALAADPALAPLARTASRAARSGSALAPTLARLARDRRAHARSDATRRARAAGVHVLAPLGICFLPAFVLLGIVPAIAGLASTMLTPW